MLKLGLGIDNKYIGGVIALGATLNPDKTDGTLSNGNLSVSITGQGCGICNKGITASDKAYWEYTIDSNRVYTLLGLASSQTDYTGALYANDEFGYAWRYNAWLYYSSTIRKADVSWSPNWADTNVIGFALDGVNKTMTLYLNGVEVTESIETTWITQIFNDTSDGKVYPATSCFDAGQTIEGTYNFGGSSLYIETNYPATWSSLTSAGFKKLNDI